MDEPKKQETRADIVIRCFELSKDDFWRDLIRKQYKDVEEGVLEAVRTWISKGENGMAEYFAILATTNEHRARRLAADFLGREEFAEKLWTAVNSCLRNEYSANIASSIANIPSGIEAIVIASDSDEGERTARPNVEGNSGTVRRSRTQVGRLRSLV